MKHYLPTLDMSVNTNPGFSDSTRPASGVREPGQLDDKWSSETRDSGTRAPNMELMECYMLYVQP